MELTRKNLLKGAVALSLTGATLFGAGAPAALAQEVSAPVASAVQANKNPQVAADMGAKAIQSFKDVDESTTPFYKEIGWLQEARISTGWADGTFRPQAKVERAAMVAFLYRLNGSPEVELPAASPFKDVDASNPFYTEIQWFAQRGITTGWGDGTYRPHEATNRDATAAFLFRYAVNVKGLGA